MSKQLDSTGVEKIASMSKNESKMMVNVTYTELRSMRSGNGLKPGRYYRITDYTTTSNYSDTSVGGHDFDVIVRADSENTLNENARAARRSGDTYFANSHLESWRLKYCLDNDDSRFSWAKSTGRGVIYWMRDEFGNECPYDFKNIRFTTYSRPFDIPSGVSLYTFSRYINGLVTDASLNVNCKNNKIAYYFIGGSIYLNENLFIFRTNTYSCYNNTFGDDCYSNTFRNDCYGNTFGTHCSNNTFGNNIETKDFHIGKIYIKKDNAFYPAVHPDLSTQPSILPQRYGNLPIYEMLVAPERWYEIPPEARIIEAFSHSKSGCMPAIARKLSEYVYDGTAFGSYSEFLSLTGGIDFSEMSEAPVNTILDSLLMIVEYEGVQKLLRYHAATDQMIDTDGRGYFQSGIIENNRLKPIPDSMEEGNMLLLKICFGYKIYHSGNFAPEFTLIRYILGEYGYGYGGSM